MFKRDTKAEKQGKSIDIIKQLTDLHAALVTTEAARIMYQEAVEDATKPEKRKRRLESTQTSTQIETVSKETTEVHKKRKTEEGKYARKMRLFQEAEQQLEQTEQTVDMDLEIVDAYETPHIPSK
ncbi:hypothetical protein [Legionella tunisiensis]|uniref:hypothetical protein n=1 Tax=Legionella tunisiensis TaxID=1034944 RepID=UPI000378FEF1|nr:hypothetical protein [Legionella tunisiensis]